MSGFSHFRTPIEYAAEQSFVSASNHKPASTPPSYADLPPHEKNLHFNSNPIQNNFPKSANTPPDQDTSHHSQYSKPPQPSPVVDYYSSHSDHPPNIERHYFPQNQHNMGSGSPHNYLNVVGIQDPPVQLTKPRDSPMRDRATPIRLVRLFLNPERDRTIIQSALKT